MLCSCPLLICSEKAVKGRGSKPSGFDLIVILSEQFAKKNSKTKTPKTKNLMLIRNPKQSKICPALIGLR